jgi:hypothetical protein
MKWIDTTDKIVTFTCAFACAIVILVMTAAAYMFVRFAITGS